MASNEVVIFNGIKFRRYPDAKRRADQVYFVPGVADRQRGIGRLHQEIWKAANGPIPDGYHVHHADHDPLNNDLSNLVLIKGRDHLSHHANHPDRIEKSRQNVFRAQEAAKAWHASPEGLAWHSENGKRAWDNRRPIKHTCEYCGGEYESRLDGAGTRFCSNNCKSQWRRVAGLDNVERECAECGNPWMVNKYSNAQTCSRSCGVRRGKRLSRERKAAA